MIIDKPGFYTSKAGKCEVVAVKGREAIGWDNSCIPGKTAQIWDVWSGEPRVGCIAEHTITGPWIDKPKPIEAWAVVGRDGIFGLYKTKDHAWGYCDTKYGPPDPRLVHLIEAEDRG